MGIADALYSAFGGEAAIHIAAFDGSSAGPREPGVGISLRSPLALRHLITGRGSLGLARAYVSGEMEINGDVYLALKALTENATDLTAKERIAVVRAAVRAGGLGMLRPAPAP